MNRFHYVDFFSDNNTYNKDRFITFAIKSYKFAMLDIENYVRILGTINYACDVANELNCDIET